MKAPAHIQNGKLTIHDRKGFVKSIAKMDDGPCTIQVKAEFPGRNLQQLRYYFGVVVRTIQIELSRVSGHHIDTMQVHDLLKSKFLKDEIVIQKTGEVVTLTRSISDMGDVSISEFAQYLEACIMWAWEVLEVEVPQANQVHA